MFKSLFSSTRSFVENKSVFCIKKKPQTETYADVIICSDAVIISYKTSWNSQKKCYSPLGGGGGGRGIEAGGFKKHR